MPASLWFPGGAGLVAGKLAPDSTVKSLRDRGLAFAQVEASEERLRFTHGQGRYPIDRVLRHTNIARFASKPAASMLT